jgi:hypothetical protein
MYINNPITVLAQARPTYPKELLVSIQRLLPAQARIVDLTAGTGLRQNAWLKMGSIMLLRSSQPRICDLSSKRSCQK